MEKIKTEKILNEFKKIKYLKVELKEYDLTTIIHIHPEDYNCIWTSQIEKINNICKDNNLIWFIDFNFNRIVINF